MRVRLISADKAAYEALLDAGESRDPNEVGIPAEEIGSAEALDAAEAAGRVICVEGPNGTFGQVIFDGERWLCDGKPEAIAPETVEVALAPVQDARMEVLQSEIEAVTQALGDVLPARKVATLRASLAGARTAIADGDPEAMAASAATLSPTRATIARFGEACLADGQ